jgi:myo-inositol 2-dehydrogenase / D-chiro-inositol 1-dehydrogenase
MVRYGIIGSGTMGREHIQNLRLIPEAKVVALADPYPASLAAAAALVSGEVQAHADYRALLAQGNVDAVVIATPNHTHAAVLADVLASGRHVLVEKPLCTTIEDARAVVAAAERHRGLFWVAMEYRYMPPVARLIEEVRRGTVGRLRMLAIREHRFPFLVKVGDWNRFARNTGGTMVEKCCHFFDLMCLVIGARPVRVFGSGARTSTTWTSATAARPRTSSTTPS